MQRDKADERKLTWTDIQVQVIDDNAGIFPARRTFRMAEHGFTHLCPSINGYEKEDQSCIFFETFAARLASEQPWIIADRVVISNLNFKKRNF